MTDLVTSAAAAQSDLQYGPDYYHSHCGDVPYTADSPEWKEFYHGIAEKEAVRGL